MTLPIETLIEERSAEMGLRRSQMVSRLGYRDVGRGLRGLSELCAGELDRHLALIAKLPDALQLSREAIDCAVAESRKEIEASDRQRREADELNWREQFQPHAVIIPERRVPSPIFVAGLIGVDKLLMIPLDTSRPRSSFIGQALRKLPDAIPAFGRPVGVVVNYTPDRAVRFDLHGRALELLPQAVRSGRARASLNARQLPRMI
jgi:hypothetical protein